MNNHELMQDDLAVLWHPCSQMKDYEQSPLIPIRRGSGVWLEDYDGKRYIDAISSWWVNLFGHANPRINAALVEQLGLLEHVLLAGFSHEPAIRLAERLIELAPKGLTRCFYADNGSSAVEVALKMSYHYWRNTGHPKKTRFITLTNSYHGETLGELAVGNVPLYKETYACHFARLFLSGIRGVLCRLFAAPVSFDGTDARTTLRDRLRRDCGAACAVRRIHAYV